MMIAVVRGGCAVALLVMACTFGSEADGGGGGEADATTGGTGVVSDGPAPTTASADTTSGTTTMGVDAGETEASSDGPATTTDMPTSDDTGSDGGSDSGSDTGDPQPSGPFGEPVLIDELSDDAVVDDDPSVRFDELEIYFNSNRSGGGQIWVSTRSDPDDPWDAPDLAGALNSPADDTTPQLSEDGLVIVLSSARNAVVHDLWVSTRADLDAPWSMPERFADISSASNEWSGLLVGDGLFVCTDRPGGEGLLDIWRYGDVDVAGLTAADLTNVDLLNTDGDECTLTLSSDGLEVFWEHRDVEGEWDVWTATRPSVDEAWEGNVPASVNDPAGDRDPWLSADGHRLYFASFRAGQWDLYVAER